MLDVKTIAKKALDGVAAKLSGVVHNITITHTTGNPEYNPTTGTITEPTPITLTGRAVDESGSSQVIIKNAFPSYVIVGGERVFFLEGLTSVPQQEDILSSTTLRGGKIMAVQDIVGAGQAFRVIVL